MKKKKMKRNFYDDDDELLVVNHISGKYFAANVSQSRAIEIAMVLDRQTPPIPGDGNPYHDPAWGRGWYI